MKKKRKQFYGIGNANDGAPVDQRELIRTVQPKVPDAEKPVKIGESVSLCTGVDMGSVLMMTGIVALIAFVGHHATKH